MYTRSNPSLFFHKIKFKNAKCNKLLIFGYIKLSNIPRNFSKSLESFRNPSKLFEIPKNFFKSLKNSRNPLKHLQIPRNFSKSLQTFRNFSEFLPRNFSKFLETSQISGNFSKSVETSPNPLKLLQIPRNLPYKQISIM